MLDRSDRAKRAIFEKPLRPDWVRGYFEARLAAALPAPGLDELGEDSFFDPAETIDLGVVMDGLRLSARSDARSSGFRVARRRRLMPLWLRRRAQPRRISHLSELLRHDGAEFIAQAYRQLLGREADAGGEANYLALLREGRIDRIEVLRSLQGSDEGRAAGAVVRGLAPRLFMRDLQRHRLVGYPVRLAARLRRAARRRLAMQR